MQGVFPFILPNMETRRLWNQNCRDVFDTGGGATALFEENQTRNLGTGGGHGMRGKYQVVFLALLAVGLLVAPLTARAGTIQFTGTDVNGQGTLNFTPGVGDALTVGAGGGGSGALIQSLFDTVGLGCGAGCTISGGTGGYMTLSSGLETGGSCSGGNCLYNFAAGGTIDVFGTVTSSHGTSTGELFTATFTTGSFSASGTVGTFSGGLLISSIKLCPAGFCTNTGGGAFGSYTFVGGSGDAITISLNSNCSQGGVCQGLVDQGSISMQTTVPEPATLSVLGAGLLALGTGLRKKLLRG